MANVPNLRAALPQRGKYQFFPGGVCHTVANAKNFSGVPATLWQVPQKNGASLPQRGKGKLIFSGVATVWQAPTKSGFA
ncbi:MAG: hypothetical protein QM800_04580 [Paludibacter sp.]